MAAAAAAVGVVTDPAKAKQFAEAVHILHNLAGEAARGHGGDRSYHWGKRIDGDYEMTEGSSKWEHSWEAGLTGHKYEKEFKAAPKYKINCVEVIDHWKDGANGDCKVEGVVPGGTTYIKVMIAGAWMRGVNWSIRIYAVQYES